MEGKLFLGAPEQRMSAVAQVFSLCLIWCMVPLADIANRGGRFLPKVAPVAIATFKRDLQIPIFDILADGVPCQVFHSTRNTATHQSKESVAVLADQYDALTIFPLPDIRTCQKPIQFVQASAPSSRLHVLFSSLLIQSLLKPTIKNPSKPPKKTICVCV